MERHLKDDVVFGFGVSDAGACANPTPPSAQRHAGPWSSDRHYEQPECQCLGRKLLQTAD